jgi:hypothetical protein
MSFPCATSISKELLSQKFVRAKMACAPPSAVRTEASLSKSAATISAPSWARAWAVGFCGSRVTARTR